MYYDKYIKMEVVILRPTLFPQISNIFFILLSFILNLKISFSAIKPKATNN
jgi:hypothetical protein